MIPNQWYLQGYKEGRRHQFGALLMGLLCGAVGAAAVAALFGWLL